MAKSKLKRVPVYRNGGRVPERIAKIIRAKEGFWSGTEDLGMGLAEATGLGGVSGALTGKSFADNVGYEYNTELGESFNTAANKVAGVRKQIAPMAAGVAATAYTGSPQAGQVATGAVKGAQGIAENLEEGEQEDEETSQFGATDNIYAPQSFELGGSPARPLIEVEGEELETQNGRVTQDFKKYPKHDKGGYRYSPQPNRTIIPAKLRDRYLEADKTGRTDIETNVIADQMQREGTPMMKKGGLTALARYKAYNHAIGRVPKAYNGMSTDDPRYAKRVGANNDPMTGLNVGNQESYISYDDSGNPMPANRRFAPQRPTSALSPLEGDYSDPSLASAPKRETNLDQFAIDPFDQANSWNQMAGAVPQSGETGTDWSNIGTAAYYGAKAAPIAYNLFKGSKKAQVLDHKDYQNPEYDRVKKLLAGRSINMKPISDEIRDSYRVGLSNIGKGTKSSGQVLSGQTSLWASRMNALANANMNAQDKNNQYRGEEASGLDSLGSRYAQTKLGVQDINDRNKAARDKYLGTAMSQMSTMAQGENRDDILYGLADQAYPDYQYNRKYGSKRGYQYRKR